jgi:arsenate reductase
MMKVLFLCTGNSARSQMAEALLRHHAGDRYEAYSAGLEPRGIHPYTVQVMNEVGIDISGQSSKDVMLYMGHVHFGAVITVCANAEARCPIFPFGTTKHHWPLDDPAKTSGAPDEVLAKFRAVRDQLDARIRDWLTEQGYPLEQPHEEAKTP